MRPKGRRILLRFILHQFDPEDCATGQTTSMPGLSQQNLLRIVSHHWYDRWYVWNPKPLIVKFAQANNCISQPQTDAMHNVNIEHNTLDKASIFCSNAKAFPLNPPGTSRSDVSLHSKRKYSSTSSAFYSISYTGRQDDPLGCHAMLRKDPVRSQPDQYCWSTFLPETMRLSMF